MLANAQVEELLILVCFDAKTVKGILAKFKFHLGG
jgi:hypothetical protein